MQTFILGMHRTGTSMLARLLDLMGFHLGPEEVLMQPKDDNPRGYWERLDVYALNEELLAALGENWYSTAEVHTGNLAAADLTSFDRRVAQIVDQLNAKSPWLIKDPRLSILFPFWEPHLEEAVVILSHRRPLEVALSLQKRDGFPLAVGVALWEIYTRAALANTQGLRRLLVTHQELIHAPMETAQRLHAQLEAWGAEGIRPLKRSQVEAFIDASLHRAKGDDEQEAAFLNPRRQRLLDSLEAGRFPLPGELSEDPTDSREILAMHTELLRLDELVATREGRRSSLLPPDHLHQELTRLKHLLDQRELSYQTREDTLRGRYEEVIADLRKDLLELDGRVRQLGHKVETVQSARAADVGRLRQRVEELRAERDEARGYLRKLEAARTPEAVGRELTEGLSQQVENAKVTIQDLRQELDTVVAENEELRESLNEKRHQVDRLSGSLAAAEDQTGRLNGRLGKLAQQRDHLAAQVEDSQRDLEKQSQEMAALRRQSLVAMNSSEETQELHENLLSQLEEMRRDMELSRHAASAAKKEADAVREELEEARDAGHALEERLAHVEKARNWAYGRWKDLERELATIHGSRAWKVRHLYIRLRRKLLAPFRALRRMFSHLGSLPYRGVSGVTRLAGATFLSVWSAGRVLKAMVRARRITPQDWPHDAGELPEAPTLQRKPRVLMLCPYPVYPPDHGGGVRLFNLIKRLAVSCELHLLIFIRGDDDPVQREVLEPLVEKLYFHHWRPRLRPDLLGLWPRSAKLFESQEVQDRVNLILSEEGIDILQLEYTELGQFGLPKFARVKVVLSEIDISFRSRQRRRAAKFHVRYGSDRAFGHTRLDWMRQLRYELQVAARSDQIHVMSPDDAAYLASYMDSPHPPIRVVPNAVDLERFEPPATATSRDRRLLFLGNFQHMPNLDGLEWFLEEVWPEIRKLRPEAELAVVGAKAPEELFSHDGKDGVEVIGPVPEVVPYYQGLRALVVPIRAGSGTRLKILEALACGMPVISTTLGAEGLACTENHDILLAEDAAGFAEAVARILDDDELCRRLGAQGRRLVEERYDWDQSAQAMLAGYAELMDGQEPAQPGAEPEEKPEPAEKEAVGDVDVSVVIPTLNGGPVLEQCLAAIRDQESDLAVEVICVDSGSSDSDLAAMERYEVRRVAIDRSDFNHGLTRDLGAERSRGGILVFLNQDAVPQGRQWLSELTRPLFESPGLAGVQGAIQEVPDLEERFFWDSCGHRFYFTRESDRWLEKYYGLGFSTVHCAIRRQAWALHPFGEADIMEDKKWQREVVQSGWGLTAAPGAVVHHTHDYDLRSLTRRCASEGYGWRLLGETYSLSDMMRDMVQPRVYRELFKGIGDRRINSLAELLFPWVRPFMLYWGNHWSGGVKH